MGERTLGFGAKRHVPDEVTCVWGARLIWPDDLVWDRQDIVGEEADRMMLSLWLNDGALRLALTEARRMADEYELLASDDRLVTLHEDELGTIVGNPQRSHGYLYVAAWLK